MTSPQNEKQPTNRLVELSEADCRELLAQHTAGRVGFMTGDGPLILPVTYQYRTGSVIFRTSPVGPLAGLVRRTSVAFEIDEINEQNKSGWSVLVVGFAEAMAYNYLLTSAWETGPVPWADGVRNLFVEIKPRKISGRAVRGYLSSEQLRMSAHVGPRFEEFQKPASYRELQARDHGPRRVLECALPGMTSGAKPGRSSSSRANSPGSCTVPLAFTLNQTRPSVVSNLMVLDQTRVCGCSHSPVSQLPRGLSCAATQARTSSTKALLVHSATGSGTVGSALKEPLEGCQIRPDRRCVCLVVGVRLVWSAAKGEYHLAAGAIGDHTHWVVEGGSVGQLHLMIEDEVWVLRHDGHLDLSHR
jgi:uncharacterized protein